MDSDKKLLKPAGVTPDFARKSPGVNRKIVGGTSLNRSILRIALPAMGGYYIQMGFNMVDMFWVGKLGPAALAAVGASTFALWSIFTLAEVFVTGSSSIIARRVGEDNFSAATDFAGRIMPSVIVGGIIVGISGLFLVKKLFSFISASEEASRYGVEYTGIILFGAVLIFLAMWSEAVFHANGDAKTPMKILIASLALNAVVTPILIFGIGPFPRLEVAGAAVGTVSCQATGVTISLITLIKRGLLPNKLKKFRPSLSHTIQTAKIGAPMSFTGFTFCMVFVVIARITAGFGDEPLAALSVAHRMEEFAWVVNMGMYIAAVTVVGQYLGMKDIKSAIRAGWRCMWLGVAFSSVFALMYLSAGKYLLIPFTDDLAVRAYGAEYLRINALAILFISPGVALAGAFSGSGATIISMLITVPIIALRIPLAALLAYTAGLGVTGIWIALASAYIMRGSAMIIAYTKVKWWKKQV